MKIKNVLLLIPFVVMLAAPATAFAELPRSILGLTMGDDVSQFKHLLWMDSSTKLADAPFLTEVNIKHTKFPGIRGGSVTYGNCAHPGKLIGVKLKFDDKDRELFDKLYDIYVDKFGKPDEWQGDAFRTVRSWKWMIKKGGERINIVLTYSKDPAMRPGVSIKLDMHTLWMDEYECYHASLDKNRPEPKPIPADQLDLSHYVPHEPGK